MIFGTVRRTRCRDPGMPLTEDVIAGMLAFHSRREPGPGSPQPAAVYRPESLLALFGEDAL